MKLAIIIGISDYQHQTQLEACRNDVNVFKGILDASKNFQDICYIAGNINGLAAKKAISEFVQKHKGAQVEELLFYFSGHGARSDDDFFYAFSDYIYTDKEVSGLRNTELDGLIRNLEPELTVKMVDACYSGGQYIKSDGEIRPVLEKSAKDSSLKKLYFLHSSSETETSWAGEKFSYFTLSMFSTLAKYAGPVRYRDLMAGVADDLVQQKAPKPTFIVQANNLEVFLDMTPDLISFVAGAIGSNASSAEDKADVLNEEAGSTIDFTQSPPELHLLAQQMSDKVFCNPEEARESIELLNAIQDENRWPSEISRSFKLVFRKVGAENIPNKAAIGKWLTSNKSDAFFARTTYAQQKYKVEEYKEVPRKPSATRNAYGLVDLASIFGTDKEYKLETIEKTRDIVNGFDYIVDPIFEPTIITFEPRFSSLEYYALCILCLFSRSKLYVIRSIEHLPHVSWEYPETPKAAEWKPIAASLKAKTEIEGLVSKLIEEMSRYIITDARSRLEGPAKE